MPMSTLVRCLALSLLALCLSFTNPRFAFAAAPPEKVKFDTFDEVEIHGTYYPSSAARKAPCAILLHKVGSDSHKDKWDKLAEELQKKDYAVLTFDFRGHGDSTGVGNGFWRFRPNQALRGFTPSNPKPTISHKDFPKEYYPQLVNDIAAAKLYLDKRNDNGDCNSQSTVLIGAEEGATLGALWMTSEWSRYLVITPYPAEKLDRDPAGKDIVCAVWLSASPRIGNTTLHTLVKILGRDRQVPMAFLYGDGDGNGRDLAEAMVNLAKNPKNPQELTAAKAIKGGAKLTGSQLLNGTLGTESLILQYLENLAKKKAVPEYDKREVDKNSYVWKTGNSPAARVVAKAEKEKTLNPVPLIQLGLH